MDNDEHKQKVKTAFDLASNGYDCSSLRFFSNSAAHLIESLNLLGDERLIDVATGTGHAAISAAEELGNGHVTGIDISEKMLEKARLKANEKNLANITFQCRDIEEMEFPNRLFDVACCAFGLFFLPDMEKALKCISRIVKPGGKIALTSFNESLMEPLSGALLDRLLKYGVEPPPLSWKKLATAGKINNLMGGADLHEIDIHTKQMGYYLNDVSKWWEIIWNTGYRGLLNGLSENDLFKFKKEHLDEVADFVTDDGLWLDVKVNFAISKTKSL